MFWYRTGKASKSARAYRHILAKIRCDDVKVAPDGSTRSMADLMAGIAAKGWTLSITVRCLDRIGAHL